MCKSFHLPPPSFPHCSSQCPVFRESFVPLDLFHVFAMPPLTHLSEAWGFGHQSQDVHGTPTSFFCWGQEHRAEHLSIWEEEKETNERNNSHRLYIKVVQWHATERAGQASTLWQLTSMRLASLPMIRTTAAEKAENQPWKATGLLHVVLMRKPLKLQAQLYKISED